jgi:hypothetical protein
MQILSKLDSIITSQKQLDNRILKIEKALEKNNNNNADIIDPNDLKVIEVTVFISIDAFVHIN